MNQLFERYTNLIITLSAAAIAFAAVFHILFYIVLPNYSPAINPRHIIMPPLQVASTVNAGAELRQSVSIGWAVILSILIIIALVGLIVMAVIGHIKAQRLARDDQRRSDLHRLAKAFEDYRSIHGHYPISSTYQPEYYTAINLSKDWNYYGLPNTEQMTRVLSDWPLSDPGIDYNGQNQYNQYLYYPRSQGRSFDLYAHLELPTNEENQDYNQLDNLLRAWGAYNYKLSSSQTESVAPPIIPEVHQQPADQLVIQPTMVKQMLPADVNQVNAELGFLADEVVANPKPELPPVITGGPSQVQSLSNSDQVDVLSQAMQAKQQLQADQTGMAGSESAQSQ